MDDAAGQDRPSDDESETSDPEQKSLEHTEKTGEIVPPDNWPKGDPETKIPT